MKLSNKSIKNLIRGAIRFEEENGYLYADRGSINQIDYLNTNFKGRNFVEILMEGSSIFIKFKTDAEKISFNYNMPLILNPKCSIDLYVNDVPYKFVHVEDIKIKGKLEFDLPSGEKTVTLYYPLDARLGVKNLVINGKWRKVKPPKTKVLWYGDSITEGYGAYYSSLIYATQVNNALNYDAINQGIGGYFYDAKFCQRMGFVPDKIIIALGTNQINHPDKFEKIKEFYERLQLVFPARKILTITPIWRGELTDRTNFNETCNYIASVAKNYGDVINGLDLVPPVNEYFMDKVHPNALGMTVYANNLVKAIKKIRF